MCWRKSLDSMQKRMLAVMNNNIPDIPHDVTLVVGEEKVKMTCHKIFLAIVSPVFEAMFSRRHSTQERAITGMEIVSISSTSECTLIDIPDVHPDGLKNIIKYAYSGEMSVDLNDVLATMYASHKYDIPELTQHCSVVLQSNLSVDNVVTIYQASSILKEMELKEKAWEFIESNAGSLLDSEEFIEFSEENLLKFLSLEEIPQLKSEADVFKAALRWGNFQCGLRGLSLTKENLKTVLKNSKSLIRFPAMEGDEFNEIVEPSGVLSSEECTQLFKYFIASVEKRVGIGATLPYSSESRTDCGKCLFCTAVITGSLILKNVSYSYDLFTVSGNTDVIKLKSVGIVLPSNFTPGTGKSVSVALHDYSLKKWTHTATKMLTKPSKICYIEFVNPVSLKSDVKYEIDVNYSNEGNRVANPVEVVQYSSELMGQSSFTWKNAKNQQLTINFIPRHYVIWALQFEN